MPKLKSTWENRKMGGHFNRQGPIRDCMSNDKRMSLVEVGNTWRGKGVQLQYDKFSSFLKN